MIEVVVDKVGIDPENGMAVVMLKDTQHERFLPIWIGALEANAIALAVEGIRPPRPLTHDLLMDLLGKCRATINHVTISDLKEDTFFAEISLQTPAGTMDVDARPSDAIALAIRCFAPIFAADKVMDTAAVKPDNEPTYH